MISLNTISLAVADESDPFVGYSAGWHALREDGGAALQADGKAVLR